ncbi:hypothetical protein [Thermomonospora cellulosilytica]|uniref:Tetratricopeptide repeat protein n=1 Tax=Thermomonospora cellulosilytica TaxID=1411118 RepID=A0A7W3RAM8_9ACTN|nr:hypothetical protein [Thermomonospora cellulosilytica]MBA9005864.1 hypothetical protein [Thermomonospora cellulosilytica]
MTSHNNESDQAAEELAARVAERPRTGPEHYQTGQVLAELAMGYFRRGDLQRANTLAAIGLVHAGLANAAAAALAPASQEASSPERQEWTAAAGVRPRTGYRSRTSRR